MFKACAGYMCWFLFGLSSSLYLHSLYFLFLQNLQNWCWEIKMITWTRTLYKSLFPKMFHRGEESSRIVHCNRLALNAPPFRLPASTIALLDRTSGWTGWGTHCSLLHEPWRRGLLFTSKQTKIYKIMKNKTTHKKTPQLNTHYRGRERSMEGLSLKH